MQDELLSAEQAAALCRRQLTGVDAPPSGSALLSRLQRAVASDTSPLLVQAAEVKPRARGGTATYFHREKLLEWCRARQPPGVALAMRLIDLETHGLWEPFCPRCGQSGDGPTCPGCEYESEGAMPTVAGLLSGDLDGLWNDVELGKVVRRAFAAIVGPAAQNPVRSHALAVALSGVLTALGRVETLPRPAGQRAELADTLELWRENPRLLALAILEDYEP